MSRTISRSEWTTYIHNGQAFGLGLGFSALASAFNIVQLWNPVGSGMRFVVAFGSVAGATAVKGTLALDTAQQLTAATILTPVPLLPGALSQTTKAILSSAQPTAIPSTASRIRVSIMVANTEMPCPPEWTLCELPEGFGFNVMTETANISSLHTIWWAEIPTIRYP